jgi:MFS family permease
MMSQSTKGGTAEWRSHFMLPIAAMLGYSVSVIHIYGINPYIIPVTTEFGWTRADFTGAYTLAILFQALMAIPIGFMVDRFGSRRLGLIGVVLVCLAFALLSTASGQLTNWYLLWGLISLVALPVQATIWTSAVATRFVASRGMAFAVTLCGASVAQFLFPPIATALIGNYGWRTAFVAHGLGWLVIILPLIILFFRGARDASRDGTRPVAAEAFDGATMLEGLRSTVYLRLLLASLFFTFTVVSLSFHYLPIMAGKGFSNEAAAWLTALIGLSSIAGRIITGFLIDRYRASIVGAIVFTLPAVSVLILLLGGSSISVMAFAAILIGLTLGAEVDVIVYLTSRYFGLKNFGALYGGPLAALSVGSAIGPYIAARIFDSTKSYDQFYWIALAMLLISSLSLFSLPKPPAITGGDTQDD